MKKSLFTLFLLLTMACPLLAQNLVAELTLNDDGSTCTLTFKVIDETPTYVTDGVGMYDVTTYTTQPDYTRAYGKDFLGNKKITSVVFDESVASVKPTKTSCWFAGLSSAESIAGIGYLNTSSVTDMSGMFANCYKLTDINLSTFDTSNVTDMSEMFDNCMGLTSLDLTGFDTSNVTDMNHMFYNCREVASLDVTHFNTSNVTDMNNMFYGCYALTTIDVTNFNTSKVKDMHYMFASCKGLTSIDLTKFDTGNVTTMNGMFAWCEALPSVDVTHFNTSNVTNMSDMFAWCYKLTSLDVTHFDTRNVTTMSSMFEGCAFSSIDVTQFNTSKVTTMSYMFSNCQKLSSLDVTHFDTSNVTDMSHMFQVCKSIDSLDVSTFNTSKVTTMQEMFRGCLELRSLDISNFDLSKVTNISWFFLQDVNTASAAITPAVVILGNHDLSAISNHNGALAYSYKSESNVKIRRIIETFGREPLGVATQDKINQRPPYYDYCGGYFTIADTLDCNSDYTPKANADADLWQSNRSLKANVWNTLVLPAGLTKAQAQASFGEDTELCYMDSYDGKTLHFKTFTDTDFPTKANTPVLVKPNTKISNLTYVGISVKTVDNNLTVTTEPVDGYTASFIGSYQKTINLGREGYYYYNGQFLHSAGHSTVNNTRGYFTFAGPDENSAAKLFVLDDGGTVTAIDSINGEPINDNAPAYNLAGQRVGNDYKGIVIAGGKKTIRK